VARAPQRERRAAHPVLGGLVAVRDRTPRAADDDDRGGAARVVGGGGRSGGGVVLVHRQGAGKVTNMVDPSRSRAIVVSRDGDARDAPTKLHDCACDTAAVPGPSRAATSPVPGSSDPRTAGGARQLPVICPPPGDATYHGAPKAIDPWPLSCPGCWSPA